MLTTYFIQWNSCFKKDLCGITAGPFEKFKDNPRINSHRVINNEVLNQF